jgi:hypothetical protein
MPCSLGDGLGRVFAGVNRLPPAGPRHAVQARLESLRPARTERGIDPGQRRADSRSVGPPLRRWIIAAAAVLTAGVLTAAAVASPDDDARSAAASFADAYTHSDPEGLCSLLTPDAVEHLGGPELCRASSVSSDEDDVDYGAYETLLDAHIAARLSATKRKGLYVTKKFGARKLARDMEQVDPGLTVKLAHSVAAAKGQLDTTVVLDTRSTGRRLVLYAESDSGSIYRLSAASGGQPRIEEVGEGIPETPEPATEPPQPKFVMTIDSVTLDTTGTAYARGTLVITEKDETYRFAVVLVLVPLSGTYYVDDILYSTLRSEAEGD